MARAIPRRCFIPRESPEKIRQVADVLLDFFCLLLDVDIVDGDAAGGGQHQAADHFQRGGFPRAVRPHQAEHLAGRHFERQVVGGDKLSCLPRGEIVFFGYVFQANHGEVRDSPLRLRARQRLLRKV